MWVVLAVVGWVVAAVLGVGLVRLRRELADASRAIDVDDPDGEWLPPVELVTIEVRNHVDLAATRTSLARPVGRMAPALLRGIVHREVVSEVRAELARQGVDAEVRIRRLPR